MGRLKLAKKMSLAADSTEQSVILVPLGFELLPSRLSLAVTLRSSVADRECQVPHRFPTRDRCFCSVLLAPCSCCAQAQPARGGSSSGSCRGARCGQHGALHPTLNRNSTLPTFNPISRALPHRTSTV